MCSSTHGEQVLVGHALEDARLEGRVRRQLLEAVHREPRSRHRHERDEIRREQREHAHAEEQIGGEQRARRRMRGGRRGAWRSTSKETGASKELSQKIVRGLSLCS